MSICLDITYISTKLSKYALDIMYMCFHKLSQYALNIYIPQPHTSSDKYIPIRCYSILWHVHLHTLSQYTMMCQFSQTVTVCFDIHFHSVTEHFGMHIITHCHSILWHVQLNKLPQYALTFISHSSHCHSILWHVQLNKLPQNAQACTILQTATVCFDMYNLPHNVLACTIHKLPQTALACTHIQTATVGCVLYISSNYHSTLWYIYKPKIVYMFTHYISKQFKMCVH